MYGSAKTWLFLLCNSSTKFHWRILHFVREKTLHARDPTCTLILFDSEVREVGMEIFAATDDSSKKSHPEVYCSTGSWASHCGHNPTHTYSCVEYVVYNGSAVQCPTALNVNSTFHRRLFICLKGPGMLWECIRGTDSRATQNNSTDCGSFSVSL